MLGTQYVIIQFGLTHMVKQMDISGNMIDLQEFVSWKMRGSVCVTELILVLQINVE